MKLCTAALSATLLLIAHGNAWARDYKAGDIEIDDVWVRATAPGQVNGGGYLELDNEGKTADRLLSIQAGVADKVEVHETRTENGVSSMRPAGAVEIPAGAEVKFAPGGYHVMFLKLKAPLKAGTEFPATLTFERSGTVEVKFKVQPITYQPGGMQHGMHTKDMHTNETHDSDTHNLLKH